MLVLAVGLQKSGSSWFFNLINDILIESGFSDSRDIKKNNNTESFIKYQSCEIEDLSKNNLDILLNISRHNTYAIKTHLKPNGYILDIIKENLIKPLIIVREPKDIIASALDAGKNLRSRGIYERFGKIYTFEDSINFVKVVLNTYKEWRHNKNLSVFKYEDLIIEPIVQLKRISNILNCKLTDLELENIYIRYLPENIEKTGNGLLHFNKGVIGRYKTILNDDQIEKCNILFNNYMLDLGYI